MQARVKDIINIMETYFPLWLAEPWDNAGLQIGSLNKTVHRAAVALDLDENILEQAIAQQIGMIITHHPLFFKGIKTIDYDSAAGKLMKRLIFNDITIYSAHTNLDAAEKGLNQVLAELLELQEIRVLDKSKQEGLFKLVVFVPASHVKQVQMALAEAGAGHIGAYSDCSFRVRGTGAFRPGQNCNPFIGEAGKLEEVDEYRLETVVVRSNLKKTLQAMENAHPYEEVAYDILRLEQEGQVFSMGRSGVLAEEMSLGDYAQKVKKILGLEKVRVVGDLNRIIRNVAVVGGAGASLIGKVTAGNIDLLITGDLKYHEARDAEAAGLALIDAGHQGTEEIAAAYLSRFLQDECRRRGLEVEFLPLYSAQCFKFI